MFTFVEAPFFTRRIGEYLTDGEYAALQRALSRNPELGDVIPGSGGRQEAPMGDARARETRRRPRDLLCPK